MTTIRIATTTAMRASNATMATTAPTRAHFLGMWHRDLERLLLKWRRTLTEHLPDLRRWPVKGSVDLFELERSAHPIDAAPFIPALNISV